MDKNSNIIEDFFNKKIDVAALLRRHDQAKTKGATFQAQKSKIKSEIEYGAGFEKIPQIIPGQTAFSTSSEEEELQPNSSGYVIGLIGRVVNALKTLLCDPSSQSIGLKLGAFAAMDLSHSVCVNKWLGSMRDKILQFLAQPDVRYYTTSHSVIGDWFTYGCGCREINVLNGKIKFNVVAMDDIAVELSGFGDVDVVFRRYNLSANQAVDLWGNLPYKVGGYGLKENVIKAAVDHSTQNFEFVEICMPNIYAGELREILKNDNIPIAPYINIVIDKSNNSMVTVGLQNYRTYIVSRFNVDSGEIYGKSLVWNAIRDISLVNILTDLALSNIKQIVFPPVAVKDATSLLMDRLMPGASIPCLDPISNALTVQPINYSGNPSILMPFLQEEKANLSQILLAGYLLIPDTGPAKTAQEVMEIKNQAVSMIKPMITRLEHEDLAPTIGVVIEILKPLMPPFPYRELAQETNIDPRQLMAMLPDPIGNLNVHFFGELAKMQKRQEVMETEHVIQKTIEVSQVDPSVRHIVNLPNSVKSMVGAFNMDPTTVNDEEYVQAARQQDAAAAQMHNNVQQLQMQKLMLENELLKLQVAEKQNELM
jgi:hypothetical protein